MANFQDILKRAIQIRDAVSEGANTASLVGGVMVDTLYYQNKLKQDIDGIIESLKNISASEGGDGIDEVTLANYLLRNGYAKKSDIPTSWWGQVKDENNEVKGTLHNVLSLLFSDSDIEITGVADEDTSTDNNDKIVTPVYAKRNFLSRLLDDEASGVITFLEGLKIGAKKLFGITKEGIAHFFSLSIDGDSQLGDNGTSTTFGSFTPDSTGARIAVQEDGTSTAEFDYITIRRAAEFREITIRELKHIGGELAISAAAMVCSKVEPLDGNGEVVTGESAEVKAYRCYFDTSANDEGKQKVFQQFKVGDQARCQQFDIEVSSEDGMQRTRYYWRLVTAVGDDYIVLSDVDKDSHSTSEPQAGDNIVQLGFRYEGSPNRQSAIILSATSDEAPSTKHYQGINNYSLDHLVKDEGYDATSGAFHSNVYGNSYVGDKGGNGFFSYDAKSKTATFKGIAQFLSDSLMPDGETKLEDLPTRKDLEGLNIRSGNLLRNTAFSGDYESADVSDDTEISEDTETFSEKLKYWTVVEPVSIQNSSDSISGSSASFDGGILKQQLSQPLLDGEPYTLSFMAKGTSLDITIGNSRFYTQELTAEVKRYEFHFINQGNTDFISFASDSAEISDIMLTYGTLAPAWSPAYADNDKSVAQFQNIKYLLDAITQGSTTIDGGLAMTQQIKVGNYRDKQMIKETGGMSGYYNDEQSPFLWGGGSLEQAIRTIQYYKDDPTRQPSDEELKDMAMFVVTHGGRAILSDIVLRGIIYAEGGVMKSIQSPNGNFKIDEEGNATLNGEIHSKNGSIGGFEIGVNRIGSKQTIGEDGNLPYSSANQMSLYLDSLIFNSKDRQAIIGCVSSYYDFLLRLLDTRKDTSPRYGAVIGVQGSVTENVAMTYSGGCVAGLNFKNKICGFTHYKYSTDQTTKPDSKDFEIDRSVNCVYATTKCYWKGKDDKEESETNQWVNIKLPELKWYDDGHEILIKRGLCNDNKVNIQARRFCNLELVKEGSTYVYKEVWYDTILLNDQGDWSTERQLGSQMDSTCYRFFKDLSVTITAKDKTTKDYRGVWVEFKHPRDW